MRRRRRERETREKNGGRRQASRTTRRCRAGRGSRVELPTGVPGSLVTPRALGRGSSRLGFSPLRGGSLRGRRTLFCLVRFVRALAREVLALSAVEAKPLAEPTLTLLRREGTVLHSVDLHRYVLRRSRSRRSGSGVCRSRRSKGIITRSGRIIVRAGSGTRRRLVRLRISLFRVPLVFATSSITVDSVVLIVHTDDDLNPIE